MPIRECLDWIMWGEKTHAKCGWCLQGFRIWAEWKGETVRSMSVRLPCFLTVDEICPAASGCWYHFCVMMEHTLKLWVKITLAFLRILSSGVWSQQWEKCITHTVSSTQENCPPSILKDRATELTAFHPGFKNDHVHVCTCECMSVGVCMLQDTYEG